MLPGSHFSRTTYGPGLLGSPNSTADSLVPAALRTHLMSEGTMKSTAARSTSAGTLGVTATKVNRIAALRAVSRDMPSPSWASAPDGLHHALRGARHQGGVAAQHHEPVAAPDHRARL